MTKTKEENVVEKVSKKTPLPEGFVTPVQFSKLVTESRGYIRPQMIYNYIRNSKTFPGVQNDEGRWMLRPEDGFKWLDDKEQRKLERESKKENVESK